MLSKKQLDLLYKIYNSNKLDKESTDQFYIRLINKRIIDIIPTDISIILNTINSIKELTYYQKLFVKEISEYIGEELVINNVKELIELENKYKIFFPKKISQNKLYHINRQTPNYIILEQFNTDKEKELDLISFSNILICDWDNIELSCIRGLLANYPEMIFRIYQTYNGYHGYCTNRYFHHASFSTHQLLYALKCDNWYISFCKINGFVTRLSPKKNRIEPFVEKYIETVNNDNDDDNKELNDLLDLVYLKDTLLSQFSKNSV